MATWLRTRVRVDIFTVTALTLFHQVCYVSAQSSLSLPTNTISPTTTTTNTPSTTTTLSDYLTSTSTVVTMSASPPATTTPPITTTESPLERHLALIIGVPTGIGLSIIGLSLCLLWLACSSYCEYRKNLPTSQQPNTAGATRSTNAQANTNNSYSKSASLPMKQVSTSAAESQAFQPEPDPEPESDPNPEQEADPERERNGEPGVVDSSGQEPAGTAETSSSQPITTTPPNE